MKKKFIKKKKKKKTLFWSEGQSAVDNQSFFFFGPIMEKAFVTRSDKNPEQGSFVTFSAFNIK